jgi:hypothetical protein
MGMRFATLVVGMLLGGAHGASAQVNVPKASDGELRPLTAHFRGLARLGPSQRPKIVAVGEEHGNPELRDLYPRMMVAAKNAGAGLNCVYFEADSALQPSINEYMAGRLRAEEVMPKGVRSMFEKWQLSGENAFFNWNNSAFATVQNLNMGAELLATAKATNMKVIAVDEQSRADYIASIFQMMIESMGGDESRARAVMERAGLTAELPEHPFVYFRDEIVFRRSRKMAERVLQSLESGECTGGFLITGALHVQRKVPGGNRIYRKGGETALDVLREAGVNSHLIDARVSPTGYRFANVPKSQKFAYFLLSPQNFEHEWPAEWEQQATIMVRKY